MYYEVKSKIRSTLVLVNCTFF